MELPKAETSFYSFEAGHDFLRRATLSGVILSRVGDQGFHKLKPMAFLRNSGMRTSRSWCSGADLLPPRKAEGGWPDHIDEKSRSQ